MAIKISSDAARRIVKRTRTRIEDSRDTHIWGDYINGLRLIAHVVLIAAILLITANDINRLIQGHSPLGG